MALLPARRGGTVARPGSQAAGRWDPFGEFEDLYQRMDRLMDRASDGLWEPSGQELVIGSEYRGSGADGRALRRDRRTGGFEFRVLLPGTADPDKITAAALADGVLTVTVPKAETDKSRRIEVTGG